MTKTNDDGIQGEGNYEAARRFRKQEEEFVKKGPVAQKAREAAEALDGPEGEELEKARRETAQHGAEGAIQGDSTEKSSKPR
jgi:hypothetical protein